LGASLVACSADMAGLVKAKKYDWKDSNLALFGSDTERKVPSCAIAVRRRVSINISLFSR